MAILVFAAIGVAFAGWGFFLIYQKNHADERQRAAEYSASYERQQIEAECVQVPRTRTLTCVIDSPDTGGEEQRAEADLKAQQEMAEWAFAMLIASCAGVLVTFAGVAYVALTLHETRKATRAAVKANATAEATLKVTREIGMAQVRGYPCINGVTIDIAPADDAMHGVHFVIDFSNSGNSPLTNVVLYCRAAVPISNADASPTFENPMPVDFMSPVIGRPRTGKQEFPDIAASSRESLRMRGMGLRIVEYCNRRAASGVLISVVGMLSAEFLMTMNDVFGGTYQVTFKYRHHLFETGSHAMEIEERAVARYTPPPEGA